MLSFLYVYSDHSILECYNLFSGVELSMRSFFVIIKRRRHPPFGQSDVAFCQFFSKAHQNVPLVSKGKLASPMTGVVL